MQDVAVKTSRVQNVFVTFDSPLATIIEKFIVKGHRFVTDSDSADVVISDSIDEVHELYRTDASFFLLVKKHQLLDDLSLPDNVTVVSEAKFDELGTLINQIAQPVSYQPPEEDIEICEANGFLMLSRYPSAQKLRVLICDSNPIQLRSAEVAFNSNNLITAASVDLALNRLRNQQFDVVLTDIYFGARQDWLPEKGDAPKEIPYGFLVYAAAIKSGVDKVAVVTDRTAANDPLVAMFSQLNSIPDGTPQKSVFVQAKTLDGVKDWVYMLKSLYV